MTAATIRVRRPSGALDRFEAETCSIDGAPSTASDAAIARYLERFLSDERPGTFWHVEPGRDTRHAA